MKQKAILYTRVSTDEQNDGYSPSDQKARLLKYCENNGIEIVGFYHDDETGKHFNRPQWLNMLTYIKRNRGEVDLLLFIKWDRFSRNIAEAYIAIKELRKYQVEPQAIEQPLNLEIPEQKLMLAFYLAAPEVDNDRRALNIFHGMRRAKKEGRWLGGKLRGYLNTRDEKNRPIIVPEKGKKQELIIKAFQMFSTGAYTIEELRRHFNKNEGWKIARNCFWKLLRNKGYIGKVLVPAYKDEPAEWVDGIHDPIIDEHTFYLVQDVLAGRKRHLPIKYNENQKALPLRGFLVCPNCGRNWTGSASKGKMGGRFYYYHCSNGCKIRESAKEMNGIFMNILESIKLNDGSKELFRITLGKLLHEGNQQHKADHANASKEIEKQEQRMKNARTLMLDGEIKPEEYREIRIDIDEVLNRLRAQENHAKTSNEDFTKQIDFCIEVVANLHKYYYAANIETKRHLVSWIFPEKLTYSEKKYRTPFINEAVSLICNTTNKLEGNKRKKGLQFANPSLQVVT